MNPVYNTGHLSETKCRNVGMSKWFCWFAFANEDHTETRYLGKNNSHFSIGKLDENQTSVFATAWRPCAETNETDENVSFVSRNRVLKSICDHANCGTMIVKIAICHFIHFLCYRTLPFSTSLATSTVPPSSPSGYHNRLEQGTIAWRVRLSEE